jgi:hypothetical protein
LRLVLLARPRLAVRLRRVHVEDLGREYLDGAIGHLRPQRPDRSGEVAGALLRQVVAVDRRDDDMAEPTVAVAWASLSGSSGHNACSGLTKLT